MRYINDYRGIAEHNNVFYKSALPNAYSCLVIAEKDIFIGEELLCDYGENFWNCIERRRLLNQEYQDEDSKTYENFGALF